MENKGKNKRVLQLRRLLILMIDQVGVARIISMGDTSALFDRLGQESSFGLSLDNHLFSLKLVFRDSNNIN